MEKKVSGKHSSMNGFAMMKGRVATVFLASALLLDRKSTRLNSSHTDSSRMPSSA